MKSCPNVHVQWSSHRVPDYIYENLVSEHLPYYSCIKNENNKKDILIKKQERKKIHGSYNQEAAEEKSKILCTRFDSYF